MFQTPQVLGESEDPAAQRECKAELQRAEAKDDECRCATADAFFGDCCCSQPLRIIKS